MKIFKSRLGFFAVALLLTGLLAGCGNSPEAKTEAPTDASDFSYSDGLDENGYWKGIKASDYVELSDAIEIPKDIGEISDEAVSGRIDEILAAYSTTKEITDRAVQDGDTVNIDYTGSVDGVPFDGGSTSGAGTDVTIGVTSYIDNFLEQLIDHKPGETFDINVTFPEDYGQENLNGKAAVFDTTINYIAETVNPELTDTLVADSLQAEYGWTTVDEMRTGVRADLKKSAIQNYIYEYLDGDVPVKSTPDTLVEYQNNAMLKYYQEYAKTYGVSLEEFLTTYVGVSTVEELISTNQEGNLLSANFSLVVQAVAEGAKIIPSDADVADYFKRQQGSEDYSEYATTYGMPYLKQMVLMEMVIDFIADGNGALK